MEVKGNGFLKSVLPDLSDTVWGANQAQFVLLQELAEFAERLKDELVVPGQKTAKDKQKVVAFVVFIRLLEIVQALVILAAYGVKEELRSLLRIFLDAYFVLANCCNDSDFIPTYFKTDETERLKLMNVAARYESELFKLINDYATTEIKDDLDAKIKKEKIEAFNSFQFAKNIGHEQAYDSIYRVTSSAVHTTPRCLENYVDTDEEGNIIVINHGSNAETTDRVVYDISWFFIKSLRNVCELFALDKDVDLKGFEQKLSAKCKTE